jgi:PadR family transcriptional regulator AphA
MKAKQATEYVLLGALFLGPKHGYEISQFLECALESTWQVSTSQLYLLLKRLEHNGLLESNIQEQEMRPSKRVFSLTSKGRKAFLGWLGSPVENIRNLRIEFLGKIFFFHSFSLKEGNELVKGQLACLKKIKTKLQKKKEGESDSFRKLVFESKLMAVESWQRWLQKGVKSFLKEVRTHD